MNPFPQCVKRPVLSGFAIAIAGLLAACATSPAANSAGQSTQAASSPVAVSSADTAAFPSTSNDASDRFTGGAVDGRVLGAGAPISGATVQAWQATASEPKQLAESKADNEGRFSLTISDGEGVVYVTATGGTPAAGKAGQVNPAIALISVLGTKLPNHITVNEYTTIASVWTNAQFLQGTALRGNPFGLRIAAGNVSNFVDLASGGFGAPIQGPLNGPQTPTMANFATLADVLAGCITQVTAGACSALFNATAPPRGSVPSDTLTAAESVAQNQWYKPKRLFDLLASLYPLPPGQMRHVPFMPYLNWAPSAWVLPLKFDGGGYRAGGKAMFDSRGDLWVGDNFSVGWQGQDSLWQGHATEFAPDGTPISPITSGFTGGGMEGGTFGAAVDAHDNVWLDSYGSKSINVFDKNGKPLTPDTGITFGGRLGLMQGIIVTPSGDVWVLGISKSQLVYFPKGDYTKGRIICEGSSAEPCKSFRAPFHLAIDQKNQIWVSNSGANHVTRFPASDPKNVANFKVGFNSSGLNVDSHGNVWVTDRFGNGLLGMAHLIDMGIHLKTQGVESASDYLTTVMSKQTGGRGGSVNVLRPDGTPYPGSPFTGTGLPGPWAVVVDGNDNIWVSNFAMPNSPIAELCGASVANCPPGMKTGQEISPPGGFVGGGLQMQTDIAVDPAGDVWGINNWQDIDSCIGTPKEALSTRCGGQGVTIFYGIAKPVRSPQIGPSQPL